MDGNIQQAKKKNWFARHKILTAIIAFFVLMIAIGSSNDNKNTAATTPENTETKSAQATATPVPMAKIGDAVKSGNLTFTVTAVEDFQSLGSSYSKKTAQGIFKVVTLKVENTGKDTKTIDSSMVKIKDDQDRTFDRSIEGQTAKGMAQGSVDMFLQQVQPGLSVTGDIVFDLPKEAAGLKIQVSGGLLDKPAVISLE